MVCSPSTDQFVLDRKSAECEMTSKRISWASSVNLCQVVPFLSEESPSQVGLAIQRNFPSMESISAISNSTLLKKVSCFGGKNLSNQSQQSVSNITRVCWTYPTKFSASCDWHVTAGKESQEVGTQNLRELNVLEAIYPQVSAIPSSPVVCVNVEQECYDDSLTPEIPLIPIEEMENKPDLEPTSPCDLNDETPEVPKQQVTSSAALDADFIAAASASCAVLLESSEKASMIDPDLLIEIFNDPKVIEQLLLNGGGSPHVGKVAVSEPILETPRVPYSRPVVCPPNSATNVQSYRPLSSPSPQSVLVTSPGRTVTPSLPFSSGWTSPVDHFSIASPSPPIMSSGHLFGPSPGLNSVTQPFGNYSLITQAIQPVAVQAPSMDRCSQPAATSSFGAPLPRSCEVLEKVTWTPFPLDNICLPLSSTNGKVDSWPGVHKDTTYLKNLVREHGGLRQGNLRPNRIASRQNNLVNLKMGNPLNQEQMNSKNNRKPCIFFNGPEGCYSGHNCPFQHDFGPNWDDGRSSKRAKVVVTL